ncbi:MurR/RpiR family transcriptional regulator [Brochothrix campestris]|uniref:MurR/RpiR family transcriptional regulator n=2 Tax=Brochothrix campestris TaxID=2757 RepID=W7CM05_9LIST|nr:MurR/RpiR family transcriptional regulator [Brochothrix campestris]EUJ38057.1 hypothetical protein BCAMP_09370 [Brochothrix campestris FSL F6-1037]
MNSVFLHLQNHYDTLSSTEQLVIDFMLRYPDATELKLKIIEEQLHVSAPTIVRAIKKLQFPSFTAFKYALLNTNADVTPTTTELNSFDQITDLIETDFTKTMAMLDQTKIIAMADTLLTCRRVFCVGIGSSASVAHTFNRRLKSAGFWSNEYSEIFQIRDIADIIQANDAILVFSLSGAEPQIIDFISSCKASGCQILSVTGLSVNRLNNLSNLAIMTHQSLQGRRKYRSRLMLSVAAEVLYETLMMQKNNTRS